MAAARPALAANPVDAVERLSGPVGALAYLAAIPGL